MLAAYLQKCFVESKKYFVSLCLPWKETFWVFNNLRGSIACLVQVASCYPDPASGYRSQPWPDTAFPVLSVVLYDCGFQVLETLFGKEHSTVLILFLLVIMGHGKHVEHYSIFLVGNILKVDFVRRRRTRECRNFDGENS